MYQVEISMILDVKTEEAVDELKKLTHHVDRLLDLNSWPEIDCVHHVTVKESVKLNTIVPKTYL